MLCLMMPFIICMFFYVPVDLKYDDLIEMEVN